MEELAEAVVQPRLKKLLSREKKVEDAATRFESLLELAASLRDAEVGDTRRGLESDVERETRARLLTEGADEIEAERGVGETLRQFRLGAEEAMGSEWEKFDKEIRASGGPQVVDTLALTPKQQNAVKWGTGYRLTDDQ